MYFTDLASHSLAHFTTIQNDASSRDLELCAFNLVVEYETHIAPPPA
jgi:hypothetical protein